MKFPKISIITPVLNQVEYIEKSIRSVIDQCYPNLEYIIIDGGSTDGTLDIIKKYEQHLSIWICEPDNGMYHALQKGFNLTTGEIMGWINADDMLIGKSLFLLADAFCLDKNIKWITGLPLTIDKDDRIIDVITWRPWSKYNYILGDYHVIQQESTFWKRELWVRAGSSFNLQFQYAGEFELWSRFFLFEKLYSITAPIGSFRTRVNEQISSKYYQEYYDEVREILKNLKITHGITIRLVQIMVFNKFKFLTKIPILNKYWISLFQYPEKISYDFATHKLGLSKF